MSVAWSIGKAKKNNLEKTGALLNPGPGHYESHTLNSNAPKYRFGKSKRDVSMEGNKTNPGPGHYENKSLFLNTPKYSMGLRLKNPCASEQLNSPGPGNYEPNFDLNSRSPSAYSMAQRPKTARESYNQPGPGEYEINNVYDRKSCKFGKSQRDSLSKAKNAPGPGHYELTSGFGNEVPKYSFGKSKKNNKTESLYTPGPGNYEEKRNFGNGPKISISFSRPQSARQSNTPGPGHYESHIQIATASSIKFGKSKRDYDPSGKEKCTVPGPCQYTPKIIDKSSTPYISFGKEKRSGVNFSEKVPGPGHYSSNYKLGEGVPKYSMRIKPKIIKDEMKVPGPGQYHTENLFQQVRAKSPSWRIGTTKKDDAYKELERRGVPGPGMYENTQLESGPSIKFGKDKRREKDKNDTPGPGSYKIPCSFRDVPRYISSAGNFEEQYRYI